MKTEVILRVHGTAQRQVINARNVTSAAAQAMTMLSPRVCRLRDVQILKVIGMPSGEINTGYHAERQHTNLHHK
jgi:hypothetical protein